MHWTRRHLVTASSHTPIIQTPYRVMQSFLTTGGLVVTVTAGEAPAFDYPESLAGHYANGAATHGCFFRDLEPYYAQAERILAPSRPRGRLLSVPSSNPCGTSSGIGTVGLRGGVGASPGGGLRILPRYRSDISTPSSLDGACQAWSIRAFRPDPWRNR